MLFAATILCMRGGCGMGLCALAVWLFSQILRREDEARVSPTVQPATRQTAIDVVLFILTLIVLFWGISLISPLVQAHLPGMTSAGY